MSKDIVLIIHNVRSAHNVGSLLRTADAMGVSKVYLSGFTPYPKQPNDKRLPYMADQVSRKISKTALGAEKFVINEPTENIEQVIKNLRLKGYEIVGLEQTAKAIKLSQYKPPAMVALIVGNEITGLDNDTITDSDKQVQIPMSGQKESLNVSVAGAIALYHIALHK